jgi:hypothetical protein
MLPESWLLFKPKYLRDKQQPSRHTTATYQAADPASRPQRISAHRIPFIQSIQIK